jgi:hypothetical protein
MSRTLFDELMEIRWRRPLTPAEQASLQSWLAAHPEDAERWELEERLNVAFERMEPVEPSTNFTSRVLQLVDEDERKERGQAGVGGSWWESLRVHLGLPRALPRAGFAWALLLLIAGGVGYHEYRERTEDQVARAVRSISTAAAVTAPEVLQDFEAIREFSQVRAEVNQTDEALYQLLGQ